MVQVGKITENYKQYVNALDTLKEALELELEHSESAKLSRALKDTAIQRFDYTYEILWKLLKNIAEYEKLESKSPRETFKNAFRLRFILEEDEQTFLDMITNRNLTSHTYNEDISLGIFNFIANNGIKAFDLIQKRLGDYLTEL